MRQKKHSPKITQSSNIGKIISKKIISQKGFSKADFAKEGTGYLPFLRAKLFYEARKDYRGEVSTSKLWKQYKESKQQLLNRGGATPTANWESLGPNKMDENGGRMITHAFDPTDSKILWGGRRLRWALAY